MKRLMVLFLLFGMVLSGCQPLMDLVEDVGLVNVEVVSGRVTLNGSAGANVTVTAEGRSTNTGSTGYYYLSVVELNVGGFGIYNEDENIEVEFYKNGYEGKIVEINKLQDSSTAALSIDLQRTTTSLVTVVGAVDTGETWHTGFSDSAIIYYKDIVVRPNTHGEFILDLSKYKFSKGEKITITIEATKTDYMTTKTVNAYDTAEVNLGIIYLFNTQFARPQQQIQF